MDTLELAQDLSLALTLMLRISRGTGVDANTHCTSDDLAAMKAMVSNLKARLMHITDQTTPTPSPSPTLTHLLQPAPTDVLTIDSDIYSWVSSLPHKMTVFVDNANVWHGLQRRGFERILFNELIKTVAEGENCNVLVFGHMNEKIVASWKMAGASVFLSDRAVRDVDATQTRVWREKGAAMVMMCDIARCRSLNRKDRSYIIVSGDADFAGLCRRAVDGGFPVTVWSWNHACSTPLRILSENGIIALKSLDAKRMQFTTNEPIGASGIHSA
jgi:hypothetical protein